MSEQESKFLAAVQVWAAAAWADGVIAEEEALALKAIISVARLTDDEKTRALGWLENKVDIEDVKVADIPEDNRRNIFSAALGVIAIDKDVAAAEKKFLDRLRTALEIDEETAAELRKLAKVD
jgi:uncharacterized membrane protein YebE (DUF533 family)